MTERSTYTEAQPHSHPRGLVPCAHCAGRGVVKRYDVYGAARRTPYIQRPCAACQGLGRSPRPIEAAGGPWVVGVMAVLVLMGLVELL